MKIAQIAPLYEAVPPLLYGGTERIVAFLTDTLVSLGHDITLFASADSKTKAKLVATRQQALRLDPKPLKSDLAAHMTMLAEVKARADEFDILHFHTDMIHFPFFEDIAERTITTLHGRLDLDDLGGVYKAWPNFPLVSISDQQRKPLPQANWLATVHHGLPQNLLPFSHKAEGGYLAFLGRISPEKRPDRAIAIAIELGIPLKIAAKISEDDEEYFKEVVKPYLDHPLIEFVGEIGETEKAAFLGNALALLFLIDWPEPFGLVMIEAMACGTPVIAWNCGSVPEVVDDGLTGYIVDSEEQAVAAISHIDRLNRLRIRRVFEQKHVATAMAKKYLELYAFGLGQTSSHRFLRESA